MYLTFLEIFSKNVKSVIRDLIDFFFFFFFSLTDSIGQNLIKVPVIIKRAILNVRKKYLEYIEIVAISLNIMVKLDKESIGLPYH